MAKGLETAERYAAQAEAFVAPFKGQPIDGAESGNPFRDMYDRLSRTWQSVKDLLRSKKAGAESAARAAAAAIAKAAGAAKDYAHRVGDAMEDKFRSLKQAAERVSMFTTIVVVGSIWLWLESRGSRR